MFTWNLPALIRNVVLFTLFCIAVNWNFMAWVFILFLMFVEMDEELTKYENYSDYFTDQLALYDFSKANRNGWNLEEQLRIFNQQNPQVIQEYQRTFNSRIQELRKRPTKTKPQDKAKIKFNKKETLRVKYEVFGYTEENYWDEPESWPTNEFVELMNHISATAMYEWYHQNGLVIPEQEYGIKNILIYQKKYGDINLDKEYKNILKQNIHEFCQKQIVDRRKNSIGLYKPVIRNIEFAKNQKPIVYNNLLYWSMSDHQRIQYNQYYSSIKNQSKHMDTRITHMQYMKYLSNNSYNNQCRTTNSVYKQIQLPLQVFKKKYKRPLYLKKKKLYKNKSASYYIKAWKLRQSKKS